jgi:hypothetical protein
MDALSKQELFKTLANKASLKLDIYDNTLQTLRLFKSVIEQLTTDFHQSIPNIKTNHPITFENEYRGDFEIKMKFGGDILIFLMHTNVFEFSRDHDVMRTSYIREDRSRSFSGVINIYNFLADSFRYKRVNDMGYLIGRVFINKDNHYFIEGKRELGFLYNDFGKNVMNADTAGQIIEAAILYTINFDLLTPPYDAVKIVSVNDMINTLDEISLRTGKRLGFQFQQDRAEG